MLKRVLIRLTQSIKGLKMSEILPSVQQDVTDIHPAKRQLEETEPDTDASTKKQKVNAEPMQGRLDRKRKVALLMVYSGTGYYGMQINTGFQTIESELCKALVEAGVIPQEHSDNMSKMVFQRAARTDKGVSALGQVVSLKMTLNKDDVVGEINKHLPEQIRVIAVKRTTKSFNCKNFCDGRTYAYLLPTYAFAPVEKFINEEYRVTDEIIQHVNEVLLNFKGTHNFHNYTSGIKPTDPSAKRYMISLVCGQPFVRDGIEFALIRIRGQSFMMHHIRKMIGVMISIVRGYAGKELLEKSWGKEKVDIPKAPGLGLMLEKLHYDGYNKRYGEDGIHERLDWSEYEAVIEEFSEKFVYSNIVQKEKEERSMFNWLMTLPNHSFDIRDGTTTPAYKAQKKIDYLNKEIASQQETEVADPTGKPEDVKTGQDNSPGEITGALDKQITSTLTETDNSQSKEFVETEDSDISKSNNLLQEQKVS